MLKAAYDTSKCSIYVISIIIVSMFDQFKFFSKDKY